MGDDVALAWIKNLAHHFDLPLGRPPHFSRKQLFSRAIAFLELRETVRAAIHQPAPRRSSSTSACLISTSLSLKKAARIREAAFGSFASAGSFSSRVPRPILRPIFR